MNRTFPLAALGLAVTALALAGCPFSAPRALPPPAAPVTRTLAPLPNKPEEEPAPAAEKPGEPAPKTEESRTEPPAPESTPEAAPPSESRSELLAAAPPKEAPPSDENPKPGLPRPKADREPTRPGEAEKITFEDLILGMQADMVFRPFMLTDRVKELEGKRVRISGNMYGVVDSQTKLKQFILLRNKECKYGPGGQADHVAWVDMKKGETTIYPGAAATIRVEGTLRISPVNSKEDGNTNHIYVLEDAVVK